MDGADATDFASVLGRAIRERGLTLESIRRRLEQQGVTVSVATLSYWQNGRSHPTRAHSQRTLTALEAILKIPPGSLVSVAPANPVKRRSSAVPGARPLPAEVSALLDSVGRPAQTLRKLSTHIVLVIAPDRTISSEVVRQVVQCTTAGASSFPVVVTKVPGVPQEVHGLSNCTAGMVHEVPEQELVLTEMQLSRPLRLLIASQPTRGLDEPIAALDPSPVLDDAEAARLRLRWRAGGGRRRGNRAGDQRRRRPGGQDRSRPRRAHGQLGMVSGIGPGRARCGGRLAPRVAA